MTELHVEKAPSECSNHVLPRCGGVQARRRKLHVAKFSGDIARRCGSSRTTRVISASFLDHCGATRAATRKRQLFRRTFPKNSSRQSRLSSSRGSGFEWDTALGPNSGGPQPRGAGAGSLTERRTPIDKDRVCGHGRGSSDSSPARGGLARLVQLPKCDYLLR